MFAVEFISSALVDIAFYQGETVTEPTMFEHQELEKLQMPDTIIMRHRPPHFTHIFSGDGYAAGYYSYCGQRCWIPIRFRFLKKQVMFLIHSSLID
ncbi:M3 family metallopeptidase [Bartonella quintana]|uniref:M3 family metallopeptidase n=1 Tax=Bartonella quintana TaxID=803 RepID=UPI0021ADD629|nr:M3 family metallopeptidase [Bartonella quintana]